MDKFKWAIIVLGAIFLFILADKWVFQPQEKEAKQLECSQKVQSWLSGLEEYQRRTVSPAQVSTNIDNCVKGFGY